MARRLGRGAGRERPASCGSTTIATSAPATCARRRCGSTRLDAASAPELTAVVRFLRDATGYESLGIGYAALALRAAPAGADPSELLGAIGTMADRLARRASARRRDARDPALAAHLEVAASYGVRFNVVEPTASDARTRVCYDGEAWERVLATPAAAPVERARAALFLSVDRCADPAAPPVTARAFNDRRLQALASIDFVAERALPASVMARVRLRRAQAYAWRAFDLARQGAQARQGQADPAARAEGTAVRELALADRGVLAPEDAALYDETAIRVAASRWATEPATKDARPRAVAVAAAPRAAGETCLRVVETGSQHRVLGERCTFGVVWANALRWSASGTVATVAVQPLPAWTELWVLRRGASGAWTFETLAPATTDPDASAGYVESAGLSPDGAKLLVVREAQVDGRASRRFQVLDAGTLGVQKWASDAGKLVAFKRWSSPTWRTSTLALR